MDIEIWDLHGVRAIPSSDMSPIQSNEEFVVDLNSVLPGLYVVSIKLDNGNIYNIRIVKI
jgi:hypothetical protein